MKTFVESYDAETADEATKETYAKYTAALAEVDKAEKAKTAAEAEHNKADEAWEKVDEAYQKAIKAADDKEAAAQKKADEELAKVEAAIKAKTPTFDPTYMASLYAQVDDAKADLQDKVDAAKAILSPAHPMAHVHGNGRGGRVRMAEPSAASSVPRSSTVRRGCHRRTGRRSRAVLD